MKTRVLSLLLSILLIFVAAAPAVQAQEAATTAAAEENSSASLSEDEFHEEHADRLPDVIPDGVSDASEEGMTDDSNVDVTVRVPPCYLNDPNINFELPVYFISGVDDMPYIDLHDWINVMVSIQYWLEDQGYGLTLETDGYLAQYTRENGFSMLFNFQDDEIMIEDYDCFIHSSAESSLIDFIKAEEKNENGTPLLFEKINKGSFDRYGKQLDINLADYQIPMFYLNVNGKDVYLVPLQTLLIPHWIRLR